MGRAAKVRRGRDHDHRKPFPRVMWRAIGTAVTGERLDFRGPDRAEIERQAERVGGRGGSMTVRRQVYDGPAANWIDSPE